MKLELKNIRVNLTFSQETINFIADLFIDGVKTACCENAGTGGNTSYCSYQNKKDILKKAEDYCKTLPKIIYGDISWDNSLECQIDSMIDDYVNNKEKNKFIKKLNKDMDKGICYGSDTQYNLISWKGRTLTEILSFKQGRLVVANQVKKLKSEGKVILNTNIPSDILELV